MCCRLRADCIDMKALAEVVEGGSLHEVSVGQRWSRPIDDTHSVTVHVYPALDVVEFSISPSVVTMEDHHGKRNVSGAMFELAARYAEKVNTTVRQTSINVPGCQEYGSERLVADYPHMRMNFELVCPGFREEFLANSPEL